MNFTRREMLGLGCGALLSVALGSMFYGSDAALAVPSGVITYRTPMRKTICPPDVSEADTRIHMTYVDGKYCMTQCVNPHTEYATMTRGGSRGSTVTVTDAARDLSVFGTKMPSGMSFEDFRAVCWFCYEAPGYEASFYHDFDGHALTEDNKRWITHYVLTYAVQGESDKEWLSAKNAIRNDCSNAVYNWAVNWYLTGSNSFIQRAIARKDEVPSGWSPFILFYNNGSRQPTEQMVVVVPGRVPNGFLRVHKAFSF